MEYNSKAGYFGGFLLAITAFFNYFIENSDLSFSIPSLGRIEILLCYVLFCFLGMLLYESWAIKKFNKKNNIKQRLVIKKRQNNLYLFKSSLFRFLSIMVLIYLSYFIVSYHYYFQHQSFNITRSYYEYLLYAYLWGGIPYCFLTLKYKGGNKYEFNDYGILLLISYRALFNWAAEKVKLFFSGKNKKTKKSSLAIIKNRRIIKVYLVFLVNFFFLTLMTKFFAQEYSAFHFALTKLMSSSYPGYNELQKFHTWYLLFFHLIFYIDVGVALIGYTIASRWLNNRTKSVDMTLYGWFVVLLCYPPMNAGFTDQFIAYGQFTTHELVTSEFIKMLMMSLILLSFSIYVWATLTLGFKFSNLTNRGIVTHGPYKYFRHPAYATKNLAWWLDNSQLLTNVWAAIALLIWNVIYMLRGITEEKHLQADISYRKYMQQVKNRFIPGFANKMTNIRIK